MSKLFKDLEIDLETSEDAEVQPMAGQETVTSPQDERDNITMVGETTNDDGWNSTIFRRAH